MRTVFRICLVNVTVLIAGSLAACTNDPTASVEYAELEQELATAQSALIDAEELLEQLSQEFEPTVAKAVAGEDLLMVQHAWLEAWNAADGETVLTMMAPGGRHYCPGSGTQGISGSDLSAFVEHGYVMTEAEVMSAVCTQMPGDQAVVTNDCLVVTEGTLNEHPGYTTVLHLRGREGSLRVVDHHAYP